MLKNALCLFWSQNWIYFFFSCLQKLAKGSQRSNSNWHSTFGNWDRRKGVGGGSWYWCKAGLVLNANTINKHTLILRKFELCQTGAFCLKSSSTQAIQLSHLQSKWEERRSSGTEKHNTLGIVCWKIKSEKEDIHSHGEEAFQPLPSLLPSLSMSIFYHFTFTEWPGSYVFDTLEMKLSSVQGEQFQRSLLRPGKEL